MHGDLNFLRTNGAKRFFNYWDSLPKAGLIPDRKSFNPAAIADLMSVVTIIEIWSRARIDLRLIGTAVAERMGFDPTGRNYLDFIAPEVRETFLRLIDAQISRPCGRVSVIRARSASGLIERSEALALPMFHERSGHYMIVACISPIEKLGYEPGGYEVLGYEDMGWVDIGAGVPDVSSLAPFP